MTLKRISAWLVLLMASPVVAEEVAVQDSWGCLGASVVALAQNDALVLAARYYNESPPDVHTMDAQWPSLTKDDEALAQVLDHPVAALMRTTIRQISIQGEGFLMGANGGLVAATDKTTDFWQGDESQFSEAIGLAPGSLHLEGDIEDDSSHSMLIKVSTPVYDPATQKNIGVLMLGFDQFIVDFQETCSKDRSGPVPAGTLPLTPAP